MKPRLVPVNPVRDVQRTVRSEGSDIVGRDRLGLAGALQHEQLGKDCNSLEVDGKRPEDLGQGELIVEYECQHDRGAD